MSDRAAARNIPVGATRPANIAALQPALIEMEQTPPASIAFAGTVTREEFARIQSRLLPAWARWYVFYPVAVVVVLAVSLPGARLSELVVDFAAFFVLFPIGMALVTQRVRAHAWKQATRLNGRVHGAITPEGIEWNTERTASRFEWARIERVARTADLTLAFYSPRRAFFFPRSFFASEAQWTAFNQAIAGYVAR